MTLFLCRHGQTEWTQSRKHTGLTDIPLTQEGQLQATKMSLPLQKIPFTQSFTSPLLRARQTSELAGFHAEIEQDLVEWNYGDYEGRTSADIKKTNPHWNIFSSGAPGGESVEQVSARADRILKKLRTSTGPIVIFSHAHFCRALAARFLGLTVSAGSFLFLEPASISQLGYEHERPVIRLWNSMAHLEL